MRKTYFAQRNEVGGIDVKFRDWFSLKAIRSEIKRISWLSKKQLAQNSAIVLLFCFVLGLYIRRNILNTMCAIKDFLEEVYFYLYHQDYYF